MDGENDDASPAFLKRMETAQVDDVAARLRSAFGHSAGQEPAGRAAGAAGGQEAGQGGAAAGEAPAAPGDAVRAERRMQQQEVARTGSVQTPSKADAGGVTAGAVARDVAVGLTEVPRAVFSGVNAAVNELADNVVGLLNVPVTAIGLDPIDISGGPGFEFRLPESVTGQATASLTQFVAGFVPAMKAVKAVGIGSRLGAGGQALDAVLAGAIADPLVFDEHQARLANLIQEVPALRNPVTEYLAADPADSTAEGKLKQVIEGLGLGAATETAFAAFKAYRAVRAARSATPEGQAQAAVADAQRAMRDVAADPPPLTERDMLILGDPEKPLFDVADPATVARADAVEEVVERQGFREEARAGSGDAAEMPAATRPVGDGVQGELLPGHIRLPDGRIGNVNLNRISTADDVMEVIRTVGDMVNAETPLATKTQSEATAKMMAGYLLTDPEKVKGLLSGQSVAGRAFTREEVLATGMLLEQNGKGMTELARKIAQSGGSDTEKLALRRMVAFQGDLMRVISGQAREAGRALQAFRTAVRGTDSAAKAVRDLMAADTTADSLARMLSTAVEPEQVAAAVKAAEKPGFGAMVLEYWMNSILSGPHTHMVNMIGNTLTGGYMPLERAVAARLPGASGEVVKGEAAAMMYGMVEGWKDGLSMFGRALKSGQPVGPDVAAKIETLQHYAITAKNLNLDENGTLGWAVNLLGTAIRIPGRFLMAEDELFKAVARRMEIRAGAYRRAVNEGLTGPALSTRMAELVQNPPDALMKNAVDFSQYATFTRPLGPAGSAFQASLTRMPVTRVVVPFVRTPANIMKFAGERSPLAMISRAVRDEIAAGGARRDLAVAKIALGSFTMATVADFARQGFVTGSGPVDPAERAVLQRQGWQPYSMKVGDRYIAFNRLDPLGMTMGIAADLSAVLQIADDVGGLAADKPRLDAARAELLEAGWTPEQADEVIGRIQELGAVGVDEALAATVVAVGNNVVSKSYMSGIASAIEIFQSPSPEYGSTQGERWVTNFATSFVPFSSAMRQTARMVDPEMRQAQGLVAALKAMTPGMSKDLPPVVDLWGRPRSFATRFFPIAVSEAKPSPADAEMQRLGMDIPMPAKNIGNVPLEPAEYARYVQLAGNEYKDPVTGLGAREAVEAMVKGKHPNEGINEAYQFASDGEDGGKALMIRQVVLTYREAAKAEMLSEFPEIREIAREMKLYQIQQRAN